MIPGLCAWDAYPWVTLLTWKKHFVIDLSSPFRSFQTNSYVKIVHIPPSIQFQQVDSILKKSKTKTDPNQVSSNQ